ncbi:hypothetical protein [Nisaea sediminum]|uniref:hypothetical protein n=1 Tax=Nisaea sediminum TaxID=2775867 RepID=UPI001869404A|nr:hypothetical protein [Nisaea sediminum]
MSDTSNTSGGGKGGQQPNIVIAPECQDIFVDGVIGAMVRDGVVRINLVNTRFNIDGSQVEHAVVSRMIMSRSGVRNLHAALEQLMGRLTRSADGRREDDQAGNDED